MGGNTMILMLALFLISGSGLILKYALRFNVRASGYLTPLFTSVVGILISFQLRDFFEAMLFLLAATAQFASFVFVSRLRQRGSFFWHAMASLAANGTWYLTMHILSGAGAYWLLFLPYIIGIITGRTAGVIWAQYIEHKFNLKSDATRDPRLAPGKRIKLIASERTFWVLLAALVFYLLYGSRNFESAVVSSLFVVIGFGVLQNFFYALNTRAAQRGNNWYIAATGVLSGVTFVASAAYLFSKSMSLVLFLPYTLSTSLGSVMGAFVSMIIERTFKIAPDKHLTRSEKNKEACGLWRKRSPYIVMIGLAVVWVVFQKPLFVSLGYSVNPLVFPLPFFETVDIPRMVIVLSAALIFLFDTALHTIVSRAGNRNHTGYHVSACIPKGTADFFKACYLALNSDIPDILPVAVLAGCLGTLYGKDISEKIERWLQARMDVEN